MKKIGKRLLVSFCGLVIILIILEVSLRLVGGSYARMSESGRPESVECAMTILAVGDSVTFGIGAPQGFSYPDQLEQMLKELSTQGCYSVINRGRPGQNSAQILTMLESWLQEFHPDIVTVLIGGQNQVNYYGYQDYLAKEKILASGWLKLHGYLDKIKVYRFVRFLVLDVRKMNQGGMNILQSDYEERGKPTEHGDRNLQTGLYVSDSRPEAYKRQCTVGAEYRANGDWDRSHEVLLQSAAKAPLSAACYNMIGSVYREKKQAEQAIPWFKKGVLQDPSFYENYEEIGGIYHENGQLDEALKWFQLGIGQADPHTLHDQSYISIGRVFSETGKTREALQFFRHEKKRLTGKNAILAELVEDYLLIFSKDINNDIIHGWILNDVEKVVDLCEKYHARVVLQNYPFEPQVNHLFQQVADKKGTIFVNQEKVFSKYIVAGVRDPEVFVPDGHPNATGYRMMAENLFQVFQDGPLKE